MLYYTFLYFKFKIFHYISALSEEGFCVVINYIPSNLEVRNIFSSFLMISSLAKQMQFLYDMVPLFKQLY